MSTGLLIEWPKGEPPYGLVREHAVADLSTRSTILSAICTRARSERLSPICEVAGTGMFKGAIPSIWGSSPAKVIAVAPRTIATSQGLTSGARREK